MQNIEIIELIESDIPDIEEVDLSELPAPQAEVSQWRKYAWALVFKEREISRIVEARKSIISKYDAAIEAKKSKVESFKVFLKNSLLCTPAFSTKTGGFKIEIPDVGKISATKKAGKFEAQGEWLNDPIFFTQPAPAFSRAVFNEYVDNKRAAGEWDVTESGDVVDIKTGEVVKDISVSFSRAWAFPKG